MKTTKEMIEVMQAFVDGIQIQARYKDRVIHSDRWLPATHPTWVWDKKDYRIKPEPKVIWVNEYGEGSHLGYDNKIDAEQDGSLQIVRRAVKYIEVLEDES